MKGNRTGNGYFAIEGKEPLSKEPLSLRLPQSIDTKLRVDLALSRKDLVEYVRQAVAEKLERDIKPN